MRPVSGPRLAALLNPNRRTLTRVFVEDADSIYRDVSDLFGFNFLEGGRTLDNVDQAVPSASILLRREHVAADGTKYSLSPTLSLSPINRNGDGDYARFLKAGRGIRIFAGWAAPDGADVYPDNYLEVLRGKIDEVDWKSSPIEVTCRGLGAWLSDKTIEVERTYADADGVAMEAVMQQILDDNVEDRLGAVVLYVPVSPGVALREFKQDRKSVLEALRDLAFQIAWDVRHLWQADGSYRLTLYQPDRAKAVADWTLGPSNYFDVSQLKEGDADIRNKITGITHGPDGAEITYTAKNDASISEYGVKYMEFTEDSTSEIDTLGELTAMVDGALSDLKAPRAVQEVENDWFPIAELGDLGQWLANGKHYDTDENMAVVEVRHEFSATSRRTFIQTAGSVIGAGQEWFRRGHNPITDTTPDTAFDPASIFLGNFREVERQPTFVRYAWKPSPSVAEIWVYRSTQAPGPDEPWPPTAADIADGATPVAPYRRLLASTTDFIVDIPPSGTVSYVQFQPIDAELRAGDVQRARVFASDVPPRIETVRQSAGPTGLYTAVALDVVQDRGLGGTLKAWTNSASAENADPTADPDGVLTVVSTPEHVAPTTIWDGAAGALLNAVKVHPGKGKRVYFEFVDSQGATSGQVSVTLLTNSSIIDEGGELIDDAIKTAAQFAAGITPVQVLSVLPSSPPDGTVVLLTTDGQLYRRVSGAWTLAVPTVNLSGTIVTSQIADAALTTAKFAAGLRPVRIVSALPGSGDVQGDTVFLTSDNKLYRWTGAAWTAAVPTGDLSGTVATAQIADAAITAAKIGAAAVQTASIANAAITTALIAAGNITTALVANGAITTALIAAANITTTTIADDAITTPKIFAGAITAAKIAAGTITATEIAALTITAGQIAAGTITAAKIAAGTITTSEIAALTITAGNIAAGTITGAKIAANTITAGNVVAGTITATEIAANTITAAKIAAGTITATEIATDTITAGQIAAGAITTSELAAGAVTAAKISAGTITATEIASATILAGNIASGTITATQIAAGTITATQLAANAITAGKIAAGAINTAALIVDGVITAVKLTVSVLSAVTPDLGIITAGTLNSVNGHSFIDLNATGSSAFIHHETALGVVTLEILANGSATFGGTVASSTFTAATATFQGAVGFTDGSVMGLVASDLYVTSAVGRIVLVHPDGADVRVNNSTYGVDILRTQFPGFAGFTSLFIVAQTVTGTPVTGAYSMKQVEIGAANSGGAGKRLLVVSN